MIQSALEKETKLRLGDNLATRDDYELIKTAVREVLDEKLRQPDIAAFVLLCGLIGGLFLHFLSFVQGVIEFSRNVRRFSFRRYAGRFMRTTFPDLAQQAVDAVIYEARVFGYLMRIDVFLYTYNNHRGHRSFLLTHPHYTTRVERLAIGSYNAIQWLRPRVVKLVDTVKAIDSEVRFRWSENQRLFQAEGCNVDGHECYE